MTTSNQEDRYGDVSVVTADGHVATVTVHRPPDNFFDVTLIGDIASAFEAIDEANSVRCIVLRAEGKNFCAGASLADRPFEETTRGGGGKKGPHLYDEAVRLFSGKTPVVAAVQGAAIGGGLGLACAADFRVGSPETRLSANFARLGFHQGFGLSVTLPAIVGNQKALEMFYTGVRLKGDEAHAIGLLDRVVAGVDLDAEAHRFAVDIATSGPLALRSIRETMRGDLPVRIRAITDREKAEQDRLSASRDFKEGIKAMAERRPPNFTGA